LKIFKEIFARLWALWGLVTFVSTFLIFIGPALFSYLIKNELKSQQLFISVSRIWMRIWLLLIGCPLRIKGRQYFRANKNYVVVFNHNSLLDVPLSAPFVPGLNKTIAKASFSKIPLFGLFYKKGSVLVDRTNEKSRRQSFEQMKKVLSKGMHMCIYPEGTRNRSSLLLKPFFDGAFKLSIETKKEIVPCLIIGSSTAMPIRKKFYLWPTPLELVFLPPVSYEEMSTKELNKKVYDIMLDEYTRRMN
jgi:1-acyl-sn-glycerol-3-phosphate acyltransferase